ncbi:hypothetical protein N7535_003476 [Penicillium sp. DV-2018c]|nr:hypothetical protein N7461_000822 [Penicillium sp. DV-2018c]KAJ5576550.1 hypothetical protein N7535_003476 [Penicillium sp. DV-2018c]
MLANIENDGFGAGYIINFIKAVEKYATHAPKGAETPAMEKVQRTHERLDRRIENIEEATKKNVPWLLALKA